MRNSFNNTEDNEFLAAGMQNSKISQSRSMSTYIFVYKRDQIITKLQQKNNTLKRQVTKIDRVLSSMKVQQKPRYGISLPQIKPDTLKKELQNAYKQIQIYEYQVQKRRNAINSEPEFVQQVNKTEKVYKEKVQIHQRLKRQWLQIKHQSKQLTKALKNNGKKLQYETLENKLTTDIKYLQQKLRDYQNKRTAHISRLQMQRTMIKEMQAEFLKENAIETLQILRQRIFKPANPELNTLLSPSRAITDIQNDAAKQQSRISKIQSQAQQAQQKTAQAFAALQNDTRLLKKMQLDYQNKINLIVKQRDEASQKNFKSRNRLLEVQFEIQTIENNIIQLKKLIDPNMFKPKLAKTDQKKKTLAKPKGLAISHSYKFVEFGDITKNGKRFSDRAIIGKVNSKIIGITLYQREQAEEFVGLQATYKLEDDKMTIKKGNVNTRIDLKKQPFREESIKLQGEDYFKTIDLFSKKKKITGISMVSSRNKILKIGDLSGERITLATKESQYPMCFFGSVLLDGFQCLGVEIFENATKKNQNQQ